MVYMVYTTLWHLLDDGIHYPAAGLFVESKLQQHCSKLIPPAGDSDSRRQITRLRV